MWRTTITCSDLIIHQTFSNGKLSVLILYLFITLMFSELSQYETVCSPLSGLYVHLVGYLSGIAEWECPQIRSLLGSSVPFLQIYAFMTREHSQLIIHIWSRDRASWKPLYSKSFSTLILSAVLGWRGWLKSTSCVFTRSCVQSVLLQC